MRTDESNKLANKDSSPKNWLFLVKETKPHKDFIVANLENTHYGGIVGKYNITHIQERIQASL